MVQILCLKRREPLYTSAIQQLVSSCSQRRALSWWSAHSLKWWYLRCRRNPGEVMNTLEIEFDFFFDVCTKYHRIDFTSKNWDVYCSYCRDEAVRRKALVRWSQFTKYNRVLSILARVFTGLMTLTGLSSVPLYVNSESCCLTEYSLLLTTIAVFKCPCCGNYFLSMYVRFGWVCNIL